MPRQAGLKTRLYGSAGVTLIEATIVLTVAAILAAAAAPVASRTLDRAQAGPRRRRRRGDQDRDRQLRQRVHRRFTPFTTTGPNGGATVEMLVSDGDIPFSAIGATIWDDVVNPAAAHAGGFPRAPSRHEHTWRRRRVYDRWRRSVARRLHQCADRSGSVGQPLRGQRELTSGRRRPTTCSCCHGGTGRRDQHGLHDQRRHTRRRRHHRRRPPRCRLDGAMKSFESFDTFGVRSSRSIVRRRARSVAGRGGDRAVCRGDSGRHHRAGRRIVRGHGQTGARPRGRAGDWLARFATSSPTTPRTSS